MNADLPPQLTSSVNCELVDMVDKEADSADLKYKFEFCSILNLMPSGFAEPVEFQFEQLRARRYYLKRELERDARNKYMPVIDDLKKK
jgi:hypothetical protein